MIKHKILRAVALCSVMLALVAGAAEPLGSSWADVTKLPDFFTGSWRGGIPVLDRPNNTPFTAQAQAYIDRYKPIQDIPFAGPRCPTPGMPIIQRIGTPFKFFYEPGMIAISMEVGSMTRHIKLNAKHSERPNPSYLGESVGHFEGGTLVVDSVGFADDILLQYGVLPGKGTGPNVEASEVIFGPHGPNLRMVERMRLIDADTLEDRMTIFDDTIWKQPYVTNAGQKFKRIRGEAAWPIEWVCNSSDPVSFDTRQDKIVVEDPAAVLKRLEQSEKR